MAVGGNRLGDAFQRVAQRAQMQVAVDPAELLASLDHARGAPAAHGGQEHTVLNGPGAASSWLSVYRQLREHRPICPAVWERLRYPAWCLSARSAHGHSGALNSDDLADATRAAKATEALLRDARSALRRVEKLTDAALATDDAGAHHLAGAAQRMLEQ